MNEITSISNTRVKQWVKLREKKHRDKEKLFLVEGEHLINEAISASLLEILIVTKECPYSFDFDKEIFLVSEEVMKKLNGTVSLNSCIGVCRMVETTQSMPERCLLLDDVQDPGNVGTIIRTAYSFGFDSVFLSSHSADVYNEKVIRSTQGALFHMNVLRGNLCELIPQLKASGTKVYGTSLRDAKGLAEFEPCKQVALVFGNEGSGVNEAILALCDDRIFIEMNRFESLNVAIAAGICCYAFRAGAR